MIVIVGPVRRAVVVLSLASLCASCSTPPVDEIPPEAPAVAKAPAPASDAGGIVVSGKAPAAKGGLPAIVILNSVAEREYPAPPYGAVMDQISLSFTPAVLFARTGQPTEFRNSDEVLHNVRVYEDETKEPAFNVAIPTGGTYSYVMKREGFYNVGCDIHPGMAAVVVSTATPYTALAAADGSFSISDVLPGDYRLTVYADVQKIERDVTVSKDRSDLGVISSQ